MRFHKNVIVALIALLFLSGCGEGGGDSSGTAHVGLTIKVPAAQKSSGAERSKLRTAAPSPIAAVGVTVVDADARPLTSTRVGVSPGEEITLALEVPAGRSRIFTVQAFDEAGAVLFKGEASADLSPGVSSLIAVQMAPVDLPSTLSISPTTLSILVGQTQLFKATLAGPADPGLVWSVNDIPNGNSTVGTITPADGASAAYAAPALLPESSEVIIEVRSASDSTLFARAAITLLAPASTVMIDNNAGVDGPECGGASAPCKTITKGLALAEAGQTLLVSAGAYTFTADAEERAPLIMKPGVHIQGAGAAATTLIFNSTGDADGAGVIGADGGALSGFTIQDDESLRFQISVTGASPTISDNKFVTLCSSCGVVALLIRGNATPTVNGNIFGENGEGFQTALRVEETAAPIITNNNFTGNGAAIELRSNASPKMAGNKVTGNRLGISVNEGANPDLGGGAQNSAGGNILSCNSDADIEILGSAVPIFARNNSWDHFPPTQSAPLPKSGIDIAGTSGAVRFENGAVAPEPWGAPTSTTTSSTTTTTTTTTVTIASTSTLRPTSTTQSSTTITVRPTSTTTTTSSTTTLRATTTTTTTTTTSTTSTRPPTTTTTTTTSTTTTHPATTTTTTSTTTSTSTTSTTLRDGIAPTPPSRLAARALNQNEIALGWIASTDNVGVAEYRIERCLGSDCSDFRVVGTTTTSDFTDRKLSIGAYYRYQVQAADAAGNVSGYSNTAEAATSIVIFGADFNRDSPEKPPDLSLPGDPSGDALKIEGAGGSVLVHDSVGELAKRPVELDQTDKGILNLRGTIAGEPPKTGLYLASWNSLAHSRSVSSGAIVLRDSSDRILATLRYRPGFLDYNDSRPNGFGYGWKPDAANHFEVLVDLDKRTTSLRIDGRLVDGLQNVPFQEDAGDIAQISMELSGDQTQSFAWDDITIALFQ